MAYRPPCSLSLQEYFLADTQGAPPGVSSHSYPNPGFHPPGPLRPHQQALPAFHHGSFPLPPAQQQPAHLYGHPMTAMVPTAQPVVHTHPFHMRPQPPQPEQPWPPLGMLAPHHGQPPQQQAHLQTMPSLSQMHPESALDGRIRHQVHLQTKPSLSQMHPESALDERIGQQAHLQTTPSLPEEHPESALDDRIRQLYHPREPPVPQARRGMQMGGRAFEAQGAARLDQQPRSMQQRSSEPAASSKRKRNMPSSSMGTSNVDDGHAGAESSVQRSGQRVQPESSGATNLLSLATSQQSATSVATSVPPRLRESERGESEAGNSSERGESEVGSAIQTTGEGSRSLRELPNDEDEDEDEDDDLRRSKHNFAERRRTSRIKSYFSDLCTTLDSRPDLWSPPLVRKSKADVLLGAITCIHNMFAGVDQMREQIGQLREQVQLLQQMVQQRE